MKLSIQNFKSIEKLENFELKPLTILSGNNSSGKSSFIQLLLILKQTLDVGSSRKRLFIQGEYYRAKNYKDLIRGKDDSKELGVDFSISKAELNGYGGLVQKSLFDSFPNYTCNLKLLFNLDKNELQVKKFRLEYITDIKTEYVDLNAGKTEEAVVGTNNISNFLNLEDYLNDTTSLTRRIIKKVNYSSFFPISYEESIKNYTNNENSDNNLYSVRDSITRINTDSIKSFLEVFTTGLYYIGPLRTEPQDSYTGNSEKNWVGIKGEYTAQLLELLQEDKIACNTPIFKDNAVEFETKQLSLLEATNYWMCKVFGFGSKLSVKETGDSYSILVINEDNLETTLKHVGFGISQILPIIVQGLIMKKGETLILEQPEIHLHPKIQSYLFDFLYSLILQGKKFIVETHSDHFITRLRRRVAEDESSWLLDQINLAFIEKKNGKLDFREVKLDEFGVYNIFPDDFIENPEKELMALLNAQMRKRKSKRN